MSRLIDILKRTEKPSFQPMGFMASRRKEMEPRLRLIAASGLDENDAPGLIAASDAALFRMNKSTTAAGAVKIINNIKPDIPWGIYMEDINSGKLNSLVKAGCDFIVFPATGAVSDMPETEDIGKIIEVDSSLDDGILRALNDLPVDAVVITDSLEQGTPLLWHQLMIFQHLTNLITKPVIMLLSAGIGKAELRALWDAGIDGIIPETAPGSTDKIKTLRNCVLPELGLHIFNESKKGTQKMLFRKECIKNPSNKNKRTANSTASAAAWTAAM